MQQEEGAGLPLNGPRRPFGALEGPARSANARRTHSGRPIGKSFTELANVDAGFLTEFEAAPRKLDVDLRDVDTLLRAGQEEAAWHRFSSRRDHLHQDVRFVTPGDLDADIGNLLESGALMRVR